MGSISDGNCSLENSYAFARQVTSAAGSNFRYSFMLLNRRQYRAMCVLYAFLRITDDLTDSIPVTEVENSTDCRRRHLHQWRENLLRCLNNNEHSHPVHPALRQVVNEFSLDSNWLETVITGVEGDLQHQPFETEAELKTYCYQVAGVVGLCCQAIWGADLHQTADLAITCGEAFQRTNILRDLQEDFQQQRLYLPREIWRRHGLAPELLQSEPTNRQLCDFLRQEILKTDQLYTTAAALDRLIQGPGRRMFRVMFQTYRQLLHKLLAQPNAGWPRKVRLKKSQKLQIFVSAPYRKLC